MKIIISLCAVFLLYGNTFATTGNSLIEVVSLTKAIELSEKNNPTLLSAEQDIIIAKQRVKEARFVGGN